MIIFLNGDGNQYISSYRDKFASVPVDIIIYAPKVKLADFERILTEIALGEELRIPMTLKDLYKLLVFADKVKTSKYVLKYSESLNSMYIEEDDSNLLGRLFKRSKDVFLPSSAFFYSKSKLVIYRKDKIITIFSLDGIKKVDKIYDKIIELVNNIYSSKVYIYIDKFNSLTNVIPVIIDNVNRKGVDDVRIYIKNNDVKLI
ncbi:hypothetical protein [Stygiolobus caldivivus]|uniref:Uncharacterized protein n=1 Tax=Stygiolobus caldivivus TaxID=2824673 RepID=A0A8D5ZIU6_9CREN|nr:hypothetical protein [Stygiolobus caldivivus]BCU70904.1 hypothetical protein KN1_22010 [Stygiolobus caldivivus]